MSLLQNLVVGAIQNSLNQNSQPSNQGLGGLLGGLAGQLPGQTQNAGLGGVLGQVLGGQRQNSPADLGGILGQVLGTTQGRGNNKSALMVALLPLVLGYIQKNGGLSGMLGKMQALGLSGEAQSWVAKGGNRALGADKVQHLFDNQDIEQVCQATGASRDSVCQGLAELLPNVVNELTPKGDLTDEPVANSEIGDILAHFKR